MHLSASDSRGLRMDDNLLDDEPHALESLLVRSVLPHRVIVDLVHAVDERDLKGKDLLVSIYETKIFLYRCS